MMLPSPSPAVPPGASSFSSLPSLTSTTAPGKIFNSRSELQEHYKSDWHRYNLKRREAELPMLNEADFNTRLEAAVALRKEREGREARSGADHRKDKSNKTKKSKKQAKKEHRRKPMYAKREDDLTTAQDDNEENNDMDREEEEEEMAEEEEQPEINPCQSLFDSHISKSPEASLDYMANKYSFYLPDSEYCIDLEGLLGYCSEKIRIGNICLYCQKMFKSGEGVMKHMRDKRHCKILYEAGKDLDEFGVFYDFSEANKEYLGGSKEDAMEEEEGGEEWEDVSDDEDMEDEDEDVDDDDMYAAYEKEITTHGFDITPLGELVFPDGRIVGHRGLARYYKQRFAPDRTERAAVRAAKEAAGDRLYAGRVYNLYQLKNQREANENSTEGETSSSTALATMGRLSGNMPTGRMGKGILVAGGGKGGFTSLSLYHYRAVVKKQRRDDARGQRLQQRSRMNMNRMDKKANNKMNGVITALAPR
ncbi:hypothetical protein ACHAWT_003404 [Skeletonema menzelii]|eukprot:scaffold29037_cov148-Skeletonema_menzelii.AAC.2